MHAVGVELQIPLFVTHVDGMTGEQEVLASTAPAVNAVAARARREVQRLEVRAVLYALVSEPFVGALRFLAHTGPFGPMMMARAAVQLLVEAVAISIVMVTDPLRLYAAQTLDFAELLDGRKIPVTNQQITLFAHEEITVTHSSRYGEPLNR